MTRPTNRPRVTGVPPRLYRRVRWCDGPADCDRHAEHPGRHVEQWDPDTRTWRRVAVV